MLIVRYLTRDILVNTGAVSLVVFLVVFSSQFVRRLADVAEGDLAAGFLASIMFFSIPSYLELILPLGFFVGLMLALGRLYTDSEMVVLSASGIGPWHLLRWVLVSGAAVGILSAGLSLGLTPWTKTKVLNLVTEASNEKGLAAFVPGRFQRRSGGFDTFYAESIESDKQGLKGLFVAEQGLSSAGEPLVTITYAERGRVVSSQEHGGRYLELLNGRRYQGQPGQLEYRVTEFEVLGERLPDADSAGSAFGDDLYDALPTQMLFLEKNSASTATLHWRLSLVLMPFNLALLALGLARTDRRRGRYTMLLPAIVLYLVYLVGLASLRGAAAEGASVGSLWGLHAVIAGIGCVVLLWPQWRLRFAGAQRGIHATA